jgi:hypothetical protein
MFVLLKPGQKEELVASFQKIVLLFVYSNVERS